MNGKLLIALDIDGTIAREDGSLSAGIQDAVAAVRDRGHEVMLATGRGWESTVGFVSDLVIAPHYVVCSNGAVTLRREGEGYLRWHVETFDPSVVLAMLKRNFPDARYMVELTDGERLFTQQLDDWALDQGRLVAFDELSAQEVCRIVVVSPDHKEEDFHRVVEAAGLSEVSYSVGWTAWLDIAPEGVDKGTALERVRDLLGIPVGDVFVAGDGRNDIGMFAWARAGGGVAVAMGQAPAEVKTVASRVIAAVDEGGLATELRRLAARAEV